MRSDRGGREVLRAGRVLSGLTLISRVLGLVRDVLMASLLGAGWVAGAFALAWTIPNLFRRLLGEGALSSAFIPHFTASLTRDGTTRARAFLAASLGTLGLVLVAIVLAGLAVTHLLPDAFWSLLFDKEGLVDGLVYAGHFRHLLTILLPYLVPICLLALIAGALQCRGSFAVPALAPVVLNLVWIGCLLLGGWWLRLPPRELTLLLAGGILVGGAAQILLQLPALHRAGLLVRPALDRSESRVRRVAAETFPVALGMAVFQVNALLDQLIAVTFVAQEGPNTYLHYSNRLFQFPLAMVGTAMAVASMPRMSALALERDLAGMRQLFNWAVRVVLFLSLPAAAGLILMADPMVEVVFVKGFYLREGCFTALDGEFTARVLTCFAFGLPLVCVTQLATRVHFALGDRRRPLRIGLVLVVVNLLLNLALVKPLGVAGLALATSLTAAAQAVWLCLGLKRLGLPAGERGLFSALAVLLAMTLFMAVLVGLGRYLLARLGWPAWTDLVLILPLGIVTYLGAALILRRSELRELLRRS